MKLPKFPLPGKNNKTEAEELKEAEDELRKAEKEAVDVEETETQEVNLTQEQVPTIIKDAKGQTLFTLKTTVEKLLYQVVEQQNMLIQQNNHMIQLKEPKE